MGEPTIRVLLADDHQVVREGLRALLRAASGIDVVGEAGDGLQAVELAERLRPDVVVMDIGLPHLNGVEAAARVRRGSPRTQVVMLSMHDDAPTVERALQAGARGYVLKGRGVESLVGALRTVHRGETWLSPELAAKPLSAPGEDGVPLSDREREILQLVAEGHTGPQIAERLGLKPKTVENHRTRIMDKLGIHGTAGLVRYALRVGIAR